MRYLMIKRIIKNLERSLLWHLTKHCSNKDNRIHPNTQFQLGIEENEIIIE